MTKLHYVGFNGYNQCPKNECGLPRIIPNWTQIVTEGKLRSCNHKFVLLEFNQFLHIYGVLPSALEKRFHILSKPTKFDSVGSCDDYLIASEGTNIWECKLDSLKWEKRDLTFVNDEKSNWYKAQNKITKFSFQSDSTDVIVLLSDGSVWVLSDNKVKLLFSNDVEKSIDVESGLEHSLILTESGCVLAFGNGSRGQLGLGDLNPSKEPVQIPALEGLKVVKIATGAWHSCCITDSGDLYAWGWNNYGQLSAFEDGEQVGLTGCPTVVEVGNELDIRVVDVACGSRHTVVLLENEEVYSTGWNAYNQLGIDVHCEKVPKLTKAQIKLTNGKLICGSWYTIFIEEL